ncbi:MAG: NADP-dependent glyceraldehyde-3-phosphate dehydrogenase [Flavobacteriales bacterium]
MHTKTDISFTWPEIHQIPEEWKISEPLIQNTWLINGELREWKGDMSPAVSPILIKSNGSLKQEIVGYYPKLSGAESLQALEAAEKAYDLGRGLWPTMRVEDRIHHVEQFLHEMRKHRHEVVKFLMWEIGKSKAESEMEFDRTVVYIIDTIDALKKLDRESSRIDLQQGIYAQIRRGPLGVVLCMAPFNYPLNETFATLIPALIMGNTVIMKPARYGVLVLSPLLKAFCESFPAGVMNIVYGEGDDTAGVLMRSGRIDVLAFIGSSRVANILKKQHPKASRLRSVLGLDAKNPAIVLQHADVDLTVKECINGTLAFNGQRCTALKMIFVHRSLVESFIEKYLAELSKLKYGMPWEEGVTLTPLPEKDKPEFLLQLIADAQSKGAQIINEHGGAVNETFVYPAVLYPVNDEMRIFHEEQFGPIVPIIPFDEVEEAIQYMVDSSFGQQVSIFGSDPAEIARLIDPLVNQVCRVNINSKCQRGPDVYPFNGRKDSAEGTLSVSDALRVFSIRTMVAARESNENKQIINEILDNRMSNFLTTDYIL